MAAKLSFGWPQHLFCVQQAFCRELANAGDGALASVDADKVRLEAEERRHRYYQGRLDGTILGDWPVLVAGIAARASKERPKTHPALARLCASEVERLELQHDPLFSAKYQSGGRWNAAGVPALYFADAPSVAMLEMAYYLPSPRLVPRDYRLAVYEMAADAVMEHWSVDSLPADRRNFPYPQSTQRMGSDWLNGATAPFLAVPSAAVPGGIENIVLANPRCLTPGTIRLQSVETEIYNPRVFSLDRPSESDPP